MREGHTALGVVLVSDDSIRGTPETLWEVARIFAEPGGAGRGAQLSSRAANARFQASAWRRDQRGNTTAVDIRV